jgi:hypothetical protein
MAAAFREPRPFVEDCICPGWHMAKPACDIKVRLT